MARKAEAEEDPPKARKSWRRRMLWLGLVLVLGLCWINGPGFRWIGGMFLPKFGMEKGFVLEGTLWSGPTLKNFVWKQEGKETAVRGKLARLRYSPLAYFGGGVPAILQDVTLVDTSITIDKREPKPKEEDKEPKPFPFKRFPQPKVNLEGVELVVLLAEEKQVHLKGLGLTLDKGSEGELRWESLSLPSGQVLEKTSGKTGYTETGLAITEMPLLKDLRLDELTAGVSEERQLEVGSNIHYHEAAFAASLLVGEAATLKLEGGNLNLSELAPKSKLQGKITQCDLEVGEMRGAWSTWDVQGDVTALDFAFGDIPVEKLSLALNQQENGTEASLTAQLDGVNRVLVDLTSPPLQAETEVAQMPWAAKILPEAPALASWMKQAKLPLEVERLSGVLEAKGRGKSLEEVDGQLNLGRLEVKAWQVPALTWKAKTEDVGHVFTVVGDEAFADGRFQLARSLDAYEGTLKLKCPQLTRLQPTAIESAQISGALGAVWKGQGQFGAAPEHSGTLTLEGINVGPAASSLLYQTDILASYVGGDVSVERLDVVTEDLKVHAVGSLTKNSLELSELQLIRGEETWLNGRVQLPLAEEGESFLDRFWKATEPAFIEIQSIPLPVKDLARLGGRELELNGTVSVSVDLKGVPSALQGKVEVEGRDVGQLSEEGLPRMGDLDLQLAVGGGRLGLNGEVRHVHLQPISLVAEVPFQLNDPVGLAAAPLKARLQIPSTDLSFLTDYFPILRRLDGKLAGDMSLAGTVAKPEVAGEITLQAESVLFHSDDLPQLEKTSFRIKGTPSAVVIEEGRTGFAGGLLGLSGGIQLGEAGPSLDLRLTAQQALLSRNERMVVRANADVRVIGPFTAAAVTGRIGLVESRYFQEIDLIPTNKSTTTLPSSPMSVAKTYGTEAIPFKDWKVDVQILTEEPFRVRTNLASADIKVDLKLLGTGAAVYPVGFIDLSETYAQLPFSRLDLNDSYVRFTQESGFPGVLDIRGESQIRDYLTKIIVTGNANKFDYVLTSSPPLPDEEIMALLGTGTTREDLVGSGQAAASRAALLLFDKIWRKVAKKDWEDPASMREKRLTFESGNVNARNGSAMTTARLRLTEHWSITGDADLEGDFRGLLHYLFKF